MEVIGSRHTGGLWIKIYTKISQAQRIPKIQACADLFNPLKLTTSFNIQ
jgi:hypothetical protein